MKQIKLTIIALVTLFTTSLFAQQTKENPEKTNEPKHEIGIDFLDIIAYKKLEISYNYLLNDSESLGARVSIFPDNSEFWDLEGYQENYSVGFNYRHYFSKKYAQGFYAETLIKFSNGKSFGILDNYYSYNYNDYKKYNAFEAGFGIGYKYASKRNFFIDVSLSISRTLWSSIPTEKSNFYLPSIKPNFGFTLGKRF